MTARVPSPVLPACAPAPCAAAPAPCPMVETQVTVPEWGTEKRKIQCTEYRNEQRTQTVTVYRQVSEQVPRTRTFTVYENQPRSRQETFHRLSARLERRSTAIYRLRPLYRNANGNPHRLPARDAASHRELHRLRSRTPRCARAPAR